MTGDPLNEIVFFIPALFRKAELISLRYKLEKFKV